jgi:hypothetical protein
MRAAGRRLIALSAIIWHLLLLGQSRPGIVKRSTLASLAFSVGEYPGIGVVGIDHRPGFLCDAGLALGRLTGIRRPGLAMPRDVASRNRRLSRRTDDGGWRIRHGIPTFLARLLKELRPSILKLLLKPTKNG